MFNSAIERMKARFLDSTCEKLVFHIRKLCFQGFDFSLNVTRSQITHWKIPIFTSNFARSTQNCLR